MFVNNEMLKPEMLGVLPLLVAYEFPVCLTPQWHAKCIPGMDL